MAKYIDKSALVAEIERRISNHNKELQHATDEDFVSSWASDEENQKLALTALIPFLNTLEVKEVDNIWHKANETPKGPGDKEILVQFADSHASVFEIDDWEYLDHQTKWAYLKDLI